MTVKELTRRLSTLPGDAEVLIQLPDDGPPVDMTVDYFPDDVDPLLIVFPTPPDSAAVWDTDTNVITSSRRGV